MKRFKKSLVTLLYVFTFFNLRAVIFDTILQELPGNPKVINFVNQTVEKYKSDKPEVREVRYFVNQFNKRAYGDLAKEIVKLYKYETNTEDEMKKRTLCIQNEIEFFCFEKAIKEEAIKLEHLQNPKDEYDLGILTQVTLEGNFRLAQYLAKNGFPTDSCVGRWGYNFPGYEDIKDKNGKVTPMHAALLQQNESTVNVFIAHGAPVDKHCQEILTKTQGEKFKQWFESKIREAEVPVVVENSMKQQHKVPHPSMIRVDMQKQLAQEALNESKNRASRQNSAPQLTQGRSKKSSKPKNKPTNAKTDGSQKPDQEDQTPDEEGSSFSWRTALITTTGVVCAVYLAKLGYEKYKEWKVQQKELA